MGNYDSVMGIRCREKCMEVWDALELPEDTKPTNSHCFKIKLTDVIKDNVPTHISIAIPLDGMGNRGIEYGDPEFPVTIETLLFKKQQDNTIATFYREDWNYGDVWRCTTIDELKTEIDRVKLLVTTELLTNVNATQNIDVES